MAIAAPASELLSPRPGGRVYVGTRRVRLGDVDGAARLRFDAITRFLQDVATDDAADAGLDGTWGWLVRRTMIETTRSPRLGDRLELATFCSGSGRSWAERRTTLRDGRGVAVEAVSLWVAIDPVAGRPVALDDRFHSVWGVAGGDRRVSARLALDKPSGDAQDRGRWPIRAVDIDPYRHANNAAQWAAVEEALGLDADRRGVAEVEFVSPIEPTDHIRRLSRGDVGAESERGEATGWLVAMPEGASADAPDPDATLRTSYRFRAAFPPKAAPGR